MQLPSHKYFSLEKNLSAAICLRHTAVCQVSPALPGSWTLQDLATALLPASALAGLMPCPEAALPGSQWDIQPPPGQRSSRGLSSAPEYMWRLLKPTGNTL